MDFHKFLVVFVVFLLCSMVPASAAEIEQYTFQETKKGIETTTITYNENSNNSLKNESCEYSDNNYNFSDAKVNIGSSTSADDGLLWWLPERWVALVGALSGSVFLFTEVFIRGYAFFHPNAPLHPHNIMLNYVRARSGVIFAFSYPMFFVVMELRRQISKWLSGYN